MFFVDPNEFVPHKNHKGEALRWGLAKYGEQGLPDFDATKFQGRVVGFLLLFSPLPYCYLVTDKLLEWQMATQDMYRMLDIGYPENQFVKALVEKKVCLFFFPFLIPLLTPQFLSPLL